MRFPALHWHRFERPSSEKINDMFSSLVNHSISTGTGSHDPGIGFSHWASVIQVKDKEFEDLQRVIDHRTSVPDVIFDKKLAVKTIAPENRRNYITADYYIPTNPIQASNYWQTNFYSSDPFNGKGGILFFYAGEYEFDGGLYVYNKRYHFLGEGQECTRFTFRPSSTGSGGILFGTPGLVGYPKGHSSQNYQPMIIANMTFDLYTDAIGVKGDSIWMFSCTVRQNPSGRIDYGSSSNIGRAPFYLTNNSGNGTPTIVKDCTVLCTMPVSSGSSFVDNCGIYIQGDARDIRIINTKIARSSKISRFFLYGVYANVVGYPSSLFIDSCEIESYKETLYLPAASDYATITVTNNSLYTEYNATSVARGLNI